MEIGSGYRGREGVEIGRRVGVEIGSGYRGRVGVEIWGEREWR